jgi:TolB-like protein/Flp pilus assembly protein TadD
MGSYGSINFVRWWWYTGDRPLGVLALRQGVHPVHGVLRFGLLEVDFRAGELRKQGVKIKLQKQPLQVLKMLLTRPGEVVTRQELQKAIWSPDTFVDFDQGLYRAIKRLRQALNDSAEAPRFIETLPGRGYRFIASIGSAVGGGIHSLAVLPLENLSRDPEQEYFADGMTEALITNLAKISALRVTSRTSAMEYKGVRNKSAREIGEKLGVDGIVEGTVVRSGERVRISAQLIDAHTDTHVWAESYDRDLRDILALQSEVARAIAREIQITLTPQEKLQLARTQSVSSDAYEAYLRGRYYWNKRTLEGVKKGAYYFQQAIDKDPIYAPAYAGLADSYVIQAYWGFASPKESAARAGTFARKALEIDDTLAQAHASLAFATHMYDWNFLRAEAEFQRSIELNPSYATARQWYALYLAMMGRRALAILEIRRALQLDPISPIIHVAFATMLIFARKWDESLEQSQKALALDPSFPQARWMLGWAYGLKGAYRQAIAELCEGAKLTGGIALFQFALGYVYGVAGEEGEARKTLEQLLELSRGCYVMPYWMATVYVGLGDKDKALHWLERAYHERSAWMAFLKVQPWFDALRPDPRFMDLMRRMNFPS